MTAESPTPEMLHPWAIYLQASEEARHRGDRRTGTDHLLLALLAVTSVESAVGVNRMQARDALESLDCEALGALGIGSRTDAPSLTMREVPARPQFGDVARRDGMRPTPAAKKVLKDTVRPNRRKGEVTAVQVMAQLLYLRPPDPAAVLLGALHVNAAEVQHRLGPVD